MAKYHYTYLLICEHDYIYIGKRSSNKHPLLDDYFSSSKYAKPLAISKEIINIFSTKQGAIEDEIRLHKLFDCKSHKQFLNKANQTSTKFDTTGAKLSQNHKSKIGLAHKAKKVSARTLALNKSKQRQHITEAMFLEAKALFYENPHISHIWARKSVAFPIKSIWLALYHNPWLEFEQFIRGL